jgi:hypothetical protein
MNDERPQEPSFDDGEVDRTFEALISQVDFGDTTKPLPDNDQPDQPTVPPLAERFRARGWAESLETPATWEDEGHFIPPEPPPLPPTDPRRRLAWWGLLGGPGLMLAAVLFGFGLPGWLMGGLVLGFAVGFVYLVSTMATEPHDPWSGDDGAVL